MGDYRNCSTEKLSRETDPKIGHGDVMQLSRCKLNTTAVVAGEVVNSKLKDCQLLVPFASGGDCPKRFESPEASLTRKNGSPPVTTSCDRLAKLIL